MKKLGVLCLLILAGASVEVAHAQARETTVLQPPPSVCGHWVVERFLTHGMKAAPQGRLLGLKAEYDSSRVQFGSHVVPHPRFRVRRWSHEEFFREYFVRASGLGLRAKTIVVVDVLDGDGMDVIDPGMRLLVRNKRQILMDWDGVFYLLDRKGPPCVAPPPERK